MPLTQSWVKEQPMRRGSMQFLYPFVPATRSWGERKKNQATKRSSLLHLSLSEINKGISTQQPLHDQQKSRNLSFQKWEIFINRVQSRTSRRKSLINLLVL